MLSEHHSPGATGSQRFRERNPETMQEELGNGVMAIFHCQLSNRDRDRIARTLPSLRDDVQLTDVLREINHHVRAYQAFDAVCHTEYYKKLIATDLAQVAELAEKMLRVLHVMRQDSCIALQRRMQKRLGHGRLGKFEQLISFITCLHSAADSYRLRGRPRKITLDLYARALVSIYIRATGTKPRRRYNRHQVGREEHIPYFAACMAAAGVHEYPTFIIRRAIENSSVEDPVPWGALWMKCWWKGPDIY